MPTSRRRSQILGYELGGSAIPLRPGDGLPSVIQDSQAVIGVCEDTVGNFPNVNGLDITKTGVTYGHVSGDTSYYHLTNFRCGNWDIPYISWYPDNSDGLDLVTKALAITNPNRPIADFGQVAQDIWDFPKLLKETGEFALGLRHSPGAEMRKHATLHQMGKNYLNQSFGIAPVIEDMGTMLDFVGAAGKRFKEIQNLRQRRGTSRRMKVHDSDFTKFVQLGHVVTSLYGSAVELDLTWTGHLKSWMTVRYKLNDDSPILDPSCDDRALAIRSQLGADFNMSTIWQLIPWTWLGDWFENLGDIFDANRNMLGLTATNACYMRTETVSVAATLSPGMGSGWSFSPTGYPAYTHKWRGHIDNPAPSLQFHLPFLNGGQLSILAALGASRTWTG